MNRLLRLAVITAVIIATFAHPRHARSQTFPEDLEPLLRMSYVSPSEPREWLRNYVLRTPTGILPLDTQRMIIESLADNRLTFMVVTNQPGFPAGRFQNSTGIVRINAKYLESHELADRLQILITLTHELTHAQAFRRDPQFFEKAMDSLRAMSTGNLSEFEFLKLVFIFDCEMQGYTAEVTAVVSMREWFKTNGGWVPQRVLNYQSYGLGPLPPWPGPRATVNILEHPNLLPLLAYRAVVEMRDDRGEISALESARLAKLLFSRYPDLTEWHTSTYGPLPILKNHEEQ